MVNYGKHFWKDVIFTDESKFNILKSNCRESLEKPNTELQMKH